MDPNNYHTIENFVNGMIELGSKIRDFEPDHIIAPMMGAVPFIDVLNIVDEDFENEKVVYMPASNKIKQVKRVIRDWMNNFLEEVYDPETGVKLVALDEVVSGNSMIRSNKQAQASIHSLLFRKAKEYGVTKEELASPIYFPFGVIDQHLSEKRGKVKEWQKLVDEQRTDSVTVDRIVTMDRPDFFPVTYKRKDGGSKPTFYPVVEGFNVSPIYINFLQTVANIVGKDPEAVSLQNMSKIVSSSNYLSDEFKREY